MVGLCAPKDLSAEEDFTKLYPKRKIKIAVAQIDVVPDNVEETVSKVCHWIVEASSKGADVVLFPEFVLSASYYALSNRGLAPKVAEAIPGPSTLQVAAKAREAQIDVIVGLCERTERGLIYDSAVYIDKRGEFLGVYRKTHVATPTEHLFASGTTFPIIKTEYGNVGILICYDLEFPETARILSLKGADIIYHLVANWSTIPFDISNRLADLVFRARALENLIPIVTCNRVGWDQDLGAHFIGKSSIINALGEQIAKAGKEEEIITADIDLSEGHRIRELYPFFRYRKPDLYQDLCKPSDAV